MKPTQDIRPTNFADALGERYLSYALSTITSRSLPDIRDGLKPVQRRILYAMLQLKLDPKSGYKKCARVVGDVIGKYHPHGDQSVYDALVRMAQEFAARYPLVDGQGNFGNIDGDNAAAMRYTESRLTDVALALLEGISENAVDFRETYDGSEDEPIVLPAAFPNLLANGTTGIAVGMATSIPPHNVDELCQALLHLIKAPQCSIEKLLDFVEGPDFPTGGVIVDPKASLIKAYSTGRGSFRLRAKWEVEKQKNGQYLIVITEIPYQIQKSKLIERIAELLTAKKLGLLQDVRDESTMDVRIVLEPKSRTIDPEMLMQSLFQQTELEVKVSLNLNVLDHQGIPRVMNLREALQSFLDHRYVVFERRSQNRLAHIDHRLEVLEGYLIAYLNLDEVIRIIREEDDAKAELIQRFKLTDVQAESILNMRLRSLRKLEEIEIRTEHQKLSDEKAELLAILGDTDKRWSAIADEIKALRTQFGKKTSLGARRTAFAEATLTEVIPLSAFIEKEPITVICSEQGWIRAAKGHLKETDEIKYKDGDQARFIFHAMTTDRLLLFASDGRFFTLGADKLPGGRGFGEPVRLMCSLGEGEDIVTLMPYVQGSILVVATDEGRGFKVSADDVIAQTRTGKNVLTPSAGHKATHCIPLVGDHVAVVGENRKILVFPADSLPLMNRGKGVRLQKYKDGRMSDLITLDLTQGLTWQMGTRTRTETDLTPWLGHRAGSGRLAPTGFPRNHKFS